jgi:RNA polymerase sigma-70 factor (ECF subfamily)
VYLDAFGCTMAQMEDKQLIKAHREGDPRAFPELVEKYADRVYAFAYRLSGDRDVAEDGAQDAFIKAWKGIHRFDEKRDFRAWIFSIAHNAVIDILRKKRGISFSSLSDDEDSRFEDGLADEGPLPDALSESRISGTVLQKALLELSVEDRSVVLLHDVEGLTFDEIGRATRTSVNTVKSRYRRALAKLRAILGDSMHQN